MTTSRQRRKQKSNASTSARSKRSAQKRLVRAPTVKGPAALRENWDKKATLRQNYQRLGLLGDLSMRDSGGGEREYASAPVARPTSAVKVSSAKTAKVIRDDQGNIVEVIERTRPRSKTAWGEALNDDEEEEGEEEQEEEQTQSATAKAVVSALESAAAKEEPVQRFTSDHEHAWLVALIAKHGDDFEAMTHDRVANVWQKTAGEIRRAIKKAGGMESLKAAAA